MVIHGLNFCSHYLHQPGQWTYSQNRTDPETFPLPIDRVHYAINAPI